VWIRKVCFLLNWKLCEYHRGTKTSYRISKFFVFRPFLHLMCFRVHSCQSPLKYVSVMLFVMYVSTIIALGVLTSETNGTVYKCTYIYSPICARTIIRWRSAHSRTVPVPIAVKGQNSTGRWAHVRNHWPASWFCYRICGKPCNVKFCHYRITNYRKAPYDCMEDTLFKSYRL
jgi:hypothetical protein